MKSNNDDSNWGSSDAKEVKIEKGRIYQKDSDGFLFRGALIAVALIAILGVLGMVIISTLNMDIPAPLNSITSASLSALVVLLTQKN